MSIIMIVLLVINSHANLGQNISFDFNFISNFN